MYNNEVVYGFLSTRLNEVFEQVPHPRLPFPRVKQQSVWEFRTFIFRIKIPHNPKHKMEDLQETGRRKRREDKTNR